MFVETRLEVMTTESVLVEAVAEMTATPMLMNPAAVAAESAAWTELAAWAELTAALTEGST